MSRFRLKLREAVERRRPATGAGKTPEKGTGHDI